MKSSFSRRRALLLFFVCFIILNHAYLSQGHPGHEEEEASTATNIFNTKPKVWIASVTAIFIISLVGLMGVAVVPLVQKVFYNHVIQFLVALAVGTLTGDAMLHLLPHAIVASVLRGSGATHEDSQTIFKGLAALSGVYFFFMAEKMLYLISNYRAEKRAEAEERQRNLQHPRRSSAAAGAKRPSMAARNSVTLYGPYANKDSAFARRMSRAMSASGEDILTTGLSSRAMKSIDNLMRYNESDIEDEEEETCHEPVTHLIVPGQRPVKNASGDGKSAPIVVSDEGDIHVSIAVPNLLSSNKNALSVAADGGEPLELKEKAHDDAAGHGHEGHGHDAPAGGGHGHGHSHEVPKSIAAVAWMVILGDGLHNFSDGLAIGAAFAQGIAGGLSTAVAVFCHELPHELGDFAVLLKTGMKVKQALFYNVVSSVLCFVGMLIGIALGNVESASYWIFAIAGGMFIYIALVDMLPELSMANVKPGESRIVHFVIQNAGIMTGVGIMLVIALYEDTIKSMLDEAPLSAQNATMRLK